jgi:glycolate oxidase iron-sulfur subunit
MTAAAPFASLKPLVPLMDKCVHCGFCLATCPSYVLLGQEMDSPRGRIYTLKAGVDERVSVQPAFVDHFDTCLGCMACETACPSGVRYAPLIEQARELIEQHHRRPWHERWFRRLLFSVLPFPARLRVLALPLSIVPGLRRWRSLLSVLPRSLRNLVELAPEVRLARVFKETPARTAPRGPARLCVGLVTGCVQRAYFGDINQATARVLSAEGCEVLAPSGQGCCGALSLHAGETEDARQFARSLIERFERANVDTIAVNAAGCGSAMKEYGHLLQNDSAWSERAAQFAAKVRDVTEILAGLEPRAVRHPIELRVAYHDACHLAHAQGVRREPRELLQSIPGVTVVPVAESEICCGSAGIFNLVQPDMAAELGGRKASHIGEAAPDAVVTTNPGCMLQIRAAAGRRGDHYRVLHIVELLDASFKGGQFGAGS